MPSPAGNLIAKLGSVLVLRNSIPEALGLRPETVVVRTVQWDGGAVGVGNPTETDLTLTPTPKVTAVGGDNRVLLLDGITPDETGSLAGGYSSAQLLPDDDQERYPGREYYYVVTATNGVRRYIVAEIDTHSAITTRITLRDADRVHPF